MISIKHVFDNNKLTQFDLDIVFVCYYPNIKVEVNFKNEHTNKNKQKLCRQSKSSLPRKKASAKNRLSFA
jgi:Trm5-related predicted tRNA methylase